jgi:hypothetical protein
MASGITDCTGKTINIGDRVRTEHGDVIDVCGGMVSEHRLFNAEKCTLVDHKTALTGTGHVTGAKEAEAARLKDPTAKKRPLVVGDCVVWGT